MASTIFSLGSILEKMGNPDKDYRYMAASDLHTELCKDSYKIDPSNEQRLVTTLLALLKDTSNNVQELAVKCLGPLVRKIKEAYTLDMIDTLTDNLLNEKNEELRDVSTLGLKAVVAGLPQGGAAAEATLVPQLQKRFAPRIITAVQSHAVPEVRAYCLEVLNELLSRMGKYFANETTYKAVLPLLRATVSTVRKRAITCIGLLSGALPDAAFAQLVEGVLDGVEQSTKSEHARTYIQCIGAVSASSRLSSRLGRHLARAVPLIAKFCDNPKSNQDDELRENCFQTFESLLVRCHKDMTPHVETVVALCLKFVKYDPNYASPDDMEDEGDGDAEAMEVDDADGEGGDGEDGDDDEDDGELSDDDDMSWKVRRSAAKCLSAVIATRIELLSSMHQRVAPVLISRFREREENVRMDVFAAFVMLLRQTAIASRRCAGGAYQQQLQAHVASLVPRVVSAVAKQMKERSIKTRAAAFGLAKELVSVAPGGLSAHHIGTLVPATTAALGDRNSNSSLKVEALTFLRLLLSTHPAQSFHPHVAAIVPPVIKSMADTYFRIAAEGLRAAAELVEVLRPAGAAQQQTPFDYKPFVQPIYAATLSQLRAQDTDQEVKECALHCVGAIVSVLGDDLRAELGTCLQLLLDRLRNEITRLTAVKVVARIAVSPLGIDLTPILSESITELTSFLRKSNRQLRQSSLVSLASIIQYHGATRNAQALLPQVMAELAPLISDSDLFLSHLALRLAGQVLHAGPGIGQVLQLLQERVLPQVFDLVRSSLLQGVALQSLLALLGDVAALGAKNVPFEQLLEQLLVLATTASVPVGAQPPAPQVQKRGEGATAGATATLSKQALFSIAQCVAAVTANAKSQPQRDAAVARLVRDAVKAKDDAARAISLLCIGEIGRSTNLSANEGLIPAIMSAFDCPNEDVRHAASFALGNVTVGCMEKYLGFVLKQISEPTQRQYLLLHSLREIIVRQSSEEGIKALRPFLASVLALLFSHCESKEEGTRNVVSECLGKLAIVSPAEVVPEIDARVSSPAAAARVTAVSAVKYAITDTAKAAVDALLLPRMEHFLALVSDADLEVRKAALLSLNFVSHHKPDLVREVLPRFLPMVLNETKVRPELIREVDLGPFKHKVDDGVETRKAAFECIYTLLDTALDRVDIPSLMPFVAQGMSDQYDVKLLTHLILARLASVAGVAILDFLDALITDPLRETVLTKAKDSAVKQEVERNDELVRSALRATAALSRVTNVEAAAPKFRDFLRQVVLGPEFADKFKEVSKEDVAASDFASIPGVDRMDTSP